MTSFLIKIFPFLTRLLYIFLYFILFFFIITIITHGKFVNKWKKLLCKLQYLINIIESLKSEDRKKNSRSEFQIEKLSQYLPDVVCTRE